MTDLSILVCGVHTRYKTFLPKIQEQLFGQYNALPPEQQDRVEIQILIDTKDTMLGAKRNAMVEMAHGEYVVFVDDDDRVSPGYITALLKAVESGADVISFQAMVTINNKPPKPCYYSKDYEDKTDASAYYRSPNHVCCVKRELVKQVGFPSIPYGEDSPYAALLKPLLKTEYKIDKPLYYYDYSSSTSEGQKHISDTRKHTKDVDVIILSKADTDEKRTMAQATIDSCIEGAADNNVHVAVVEQNPDVTYRDATTYYRYDDFNYNRFANFGISKGNSDWVVVANNDLIFEGGWLDALLSAGRPVTSPYTPNDWRQKDVTANELGWVNGRHFAGWCFMIERWLWEEIGELDDSVSFWCSDDVVIEQLKAQNIKPMLVKDAVVKHLVSKTLNSQPIDLQEKLTYGNVKIFNEKYNKELLKGNKEYEDYLRRNP